MEYNNTVPAIPTSNSSKIWFITTLFLFFFLLASITGNFYLLSKQQSAPGISAPASSASDIFEVQSAFVTGKITKVDGNKVIVANKAGVEGELLVANNISISDLNSMAATPSGDIKSIQTNKNANINAQVIDNEYQITSISYIQETIDLTTIPKVPARSPEINPFPSASASGIVR